MRAAAEQRVREAEQVAARPRRTSGEILLHVMHASDDAMLTAEEQLVSGSATLESLTERERVRIQAAQIAAKVRDMGVEEDQRQITADMVKDLSAILDEVFERWPGFPAGQYSPDGRVFRRLVREVILWHSAGGPRPGPVVLPEAIEAPQPAVRPVEPPVPVPTPVDEGVVVEPEVPAERVVHTPVAEERVSVGRGLVRVPASLPARRVSATVGRFAACPRCGRPQDPGHDRLGCGGVW